MCVSGVIVRDKCIISAVICTVSSYTTTSLPPLSPSIPPSPPSSLPLSLSTLPLSLPLTQQYKNMVVGGHLPVTLEKAIYLSALQLHIEVSVLRLYGLLVLFINFLLLIPLSPPHSTPSTSLLLIHLLPLSTLPPPLPQPWPPRRLSCRTQARLCLP